MKLDRDLLPFQLIQDVFPGEIRNPKEIGVFSVKLDKIVLRSGG